MLDRVENAVRMASAPTARELPRAIAIAALRAMREPTDDMCNATDAGERPPSHVWRDMIDAALDNQET